MFEENRLYDVVIIGAGISGLTAAYNLKKKFKNIKILILEAKDRVGGRTKTIEMKCSIENKKSLWDVGGQWVSDSQTQITDLLKDLNIQTYAQFTNGKKILEAKKKIATYNSSFPNISIFGLIDLHFIISKINSNSDKLNTLHPFENLELAQRLDSSSLDTFLFSSSFSSISRGIIQAGIRTVLGAETNQINALYALNYFKSSGSFDKLTSNEKGSAQEKKIIGGAQQISQKMLDFIKEKSEGSEDNYGNILFNKALIEIDQSLNEKDEIEPVYLHTYDTVTNEKQTFKARKVISAIPINQYINIKFNPELPYFKRNVFKFGQVGNALKIIITYKKAFWRDKGFSGESVSDGSTMFLNEKNFNNNYNNSNIRELSFNRKIPTIGPISATFDATNCENQPALVCFVAGRPAIEWLDQTPELRKVEIIESLVRFFGVESRDFVDYIEYSWNDEKFNGGCPGVNIGSSGIMEDYGRATREPFINVHFAGTESATQWQGYMEGAVESGQRASEEIIYVMNFPQENIRTE